MEHWLKIREKLEIANGFNSLFLPLLEIWMWNSAHQDLCITLILVVEISMII